MKQDLIGQTIGNYKIEEFIGDGGMGQVYRGTHVLLNRRAAVKVMHPYLAADPGFQARFLQEAKAAADLNHPGIVQVYDFGEHEDQFYLVMELMSDGSLRALLRARHSNPESASMRTALDLVRQAADGLSYAHSRAMVHRDIKPDNLLLRLAGDHRSDKPDYTLKIGDFGLAQLAESAVRTLSGVTMGTPAYMSPEQAQGTDVDGRSDIYSLGVVLYELATGFLPFETRTLSDAVYKHVYTAPTPPRQVYPGVTEPVEAVILRCLEKDPHARYASAADMSIAVQAVLDGLDPTTVVPGPPSTQIQGFSTTSDQPRIQETVLDTPGDRPPRFLPTLAGATQTPRLQVLRQNGEQLGIVELTGDGLSVGRLEGNNLVLDEESVSRYHLRVDWDGRRVRVTDLGSRNGTLLGGHRLLPHVSQDWDPAAWLQLGTVWIRLDMPARQPAQETAAVSAVQGTGPLPGIPDPGRIQVVMEQSETVITPGQPVTIHGTLANLGKTVDHLSIAVDGVPPEWIRIPAQDVQLNPGARAPLTFQINVPRAPESYAGQYPVTVRANSRENPGESGTAQAVWRVQPFADSQLTISPARNSGRTQASYRVALLNAGNESARFSFRGQDDEDALRYQFQEENVELGAGESATVPLKVQAPRRWIGNAQDRAFRVRANPATGKPQSINAQLQHKAVIPVWTVPFIGIAIAGLVVLLNILLTPTIQAFELDQSDAEYAAGEDVTLSWIVGRARSIDIQNLPDGIIVGDNGRLPGRSDFTFTPTWTGEHTVTLIAKSWLKTREEVVRISVLPPDPDAPVIERFSIEPASVIEGDTVTVSWSVAGADNVTLELPNGTNRAGLPPEGQLPDVPVSTGAYVLKASVGGISATPQLLEVQVAPAADPQATDDGGAGDEMDPGGGDDGAGDDSPPEIPPAPTIAIQPAATIELVEGACFLLTWEIQHVESTRLDGEPVDPVGEQTACPNSETTYVWEMTGIDGNEYDEARTIIVNEPMEIDAPITIGDLTGNWKNNGFGREFGITRIEISELGGGDVSVRTYVRCTSPSNCSPEPSNVPSLAPIGSYGIELGVDTVTPDDLPKLHAEYTVDDEEFRLTLGVKDDNLIARLYYFELGLLHEFNLEPAGEPMAEFVFSDPDGFTEDPLYEAP